jgi:hypothetical protein
MICSIPSVLPSAEGKPRLSQLRADPLSGAEAVDFEAVLAQAMADAEEIKPLVTDVSAALHALNKAGHNLLFEGAQGACSTSITAPIRLSPRRTALPARPQPVRASVRGCCITCWDHQGLLHARRRRAFPE